MTGLRRAAAACAVAAVLAACGSSSGSPEPAGGAGSADGGPTAPSPGATVASEGPPAGLRRVPVTGTGNSTTPGRAALVGGEARRVGVGVAPVRLLVVDGETPGFVVIGDDGSVAGVDVDVVGAPVVDPAGEPVTAVAAGAGSAEIVGWELPDLGDHVPLYDATPTVSSDGAVAVLADGTDRYPHGILGDPLEAATLVIVHLDGDLTVIEAPAPGVFEDLRPTWADVDGDGTDEVLVTFSGGGAGAQVVAYESDGTVSTATPAISTPNRWRHRIAVAPLGADGRAVYVEVITPHIGGDLTLRVAAPEGLVRTDRAAPYGSHAIFSRELDGGQVFDADGDGELEIVVPAQDRRSLVVFDVVDGELAGSSTVDLGGELATGIAIARGGAGALSVAVGITDGTVLVWDGA
ncbi:MAG: VCBS repeat-containing protein [Acidimicrobiales bacterium]